MTIVQPATTTAWKFDWKLGAVLALFLSVSLPALNDVFIYIPDSARYLVWANSLSHFRGLVDDSGPELVRYVVHAPLYAFLLAPALLLFPGSVAAAKILTVLFGVGLLILVHFFLFQRVGKTAAALGSLFLALNPLHILYSTQILSDVPFAVLIVLVLILVERVVLRPPRIDAAIAGFAGLAAAVMMLREVGITLVAACVVLFLLRKEYSRAMVVIVVCMMFYALWFLRNEVLVAGLEHPPLRNTELMTSHLFTLQSASLLEELLARISVNAHAYAGISSKLLLLTQYDARGYGIIPPGDFAFGWVLKNGRFLAIPFSILTVTLCMTGLWYEWKRRESGKLAVLFLLFYIPLILIYPFNDIRFLFPLLVVMLVFAVIGVREVLKKVLHQMKPEGAGVVAGMLCVLLVAAPNAAWVWSFVKNNAAYRSDSEKFFEAMAPRPDAPELLLFPMSRIGEWLRRNTEPDAVIATRWKQLTFWLEGRKLLELNPMLPVDRFENQIRDYRAGYLVALLDRSRLREFESQMAFSTRFSFLPVHRIGNAVIIKIYRADEKPEKVESLSADAGMSRFLDSLNRTDEQIQYLFRSGLQKMDSGRPEEAEEIFQNLSTRAGRSGTVVLYTAIARSFEGRFEEAETLLRNVREGQQAGPLLVHSWYHLQIVEKLRQVEKAEDTTVRADLLTKIAGDYWSLGFRDHAENILRRAIDSDSSFTPALVIGIYFDLQRKDTASAKNRVRQLRSADISHPAVKLFGDLLSNSEAAARERDLQASLARREAVADCYERLGLTESAIDELTDILHLDPSRLTALRRLATIYAGRGVHSAAGKILRQIAQIAPRDPILEKLKNELEQS